MRFTLGGAFHAWWCVSRLGVRFTPGSPPISTPGIHSKIHYATFGRSFDWLSGGFEEAFSALVNPRDSSRPEGPRRRPWGHRGAADRLLLSGPLVGLYKIVLGVWVGAGNLAILKNDRGIHPPLV